MEGSETAPPRREYPELVSSIPPHSVRFTGRLFMGSRAATRQLQATDGVIGSALRSKPIRKRYATVSVWRDDAALDALASARPARSAHDASRTRDERAPLHALVDVRRRRDPDLGGGQPTTRVGRRRTESPVRASRSASWLPVTATAAVTTVMATNQAT